MSDAHVERLEALVTELRDEVAGLRSRLAAVERRDRVEPEAPEMDPRVSRRALLGRVGAAAAAGAVGAVVAGGAVAQPAAAATGDFFKLGWGNVATTSTELYIDFPDSYTDVSRGIGVSDSGHAEPGLGYVAAYARDRGSNATNWPAFRGDAVATSAFYGTSGSQPAVFGSSTGSSGVRGETTGSGQAGVLGTTQSGAGVLGTATTGAGVYGASTSGDAMRAVGGSGKGIFATANGAPAVHGAATSGHGVQGESVSGYGVWGDSQSLYGVTATSETGTALYAASTSGKGVRGASGNNIGVEGFGTYGGSFQGKQAAVRIVPQTTAGKPTSSLHARGELLCDKNGVLWFCTAGGNPGTWKKVTLS